MHFLLGKSLGMLLGLGLLLVLVRALSVQDYAFYVAALALLEITSQLSSFGLHAAAQRYLPEYFHNGEGRRLSRLIGWLSVARLITLVLAVGLVYSLFNLFAPTFALTGYSTAVSLYLLVILSEGFARYLDVMFDSLLMQGVTQVSLLARSTIRLAGLGYLLHTGGGPVTLTTWIWVDACAGLAGASWGSYRLWLFTRRAKLHQPGTGVELNVRRYFRFSLPNYLAASLYTASGQEVIKLVAARILPITQFAAFGFAASLSAMLQRYLPMFLLIGMIRPLFVAARQRQDYARRLPFMAALVFKLNVFFLAPAIAFLAIAGEPLAHLLTGGRYPETGSYLLALSFLLLAQALRGVASLTAQAMENARAPLIGTSLGLGGLLLGVSLSHWLGAHGLILGLILSEMMFAGWVFHALQDSGLKHAPHWSGYLRLLLGLLLATGFVVLLYGQIAATGAIALATGALVIVLVYLLVCALFKPFTQQERDTLNGILRKKVFVW